ncbi:FAD-linked oxidase [Microtetraspora sp. NBRC 13810]|uniref:FAD-dependent oxidoreductase n=1 Tax=Microtetraspora sp. NBRC 13810 TaxID=3030990 RepID=UPI0024A2C0A5|nr:BBE domain-containing protein [Microtetraspora sp. NBRC 13810]GLW08190.1 FAD-linked oxidase [Microtetraspora sp. NBRC 13810]
MSEVTRRGFMGGSAALGGGVAAGLLPAAPALAAAQAEGPPPLGPVVVRPGDPRYEDLVVRRTNQRFRPEPEYFHVVGSTDQVVKAVGDAVRAGRRVTVRSGGHCYENFVGDGAQVVIDMCEMSEVYFDEERGAFAIEAGATLMQTYRKLYLGWGVTIPGGQCGGVAAGGHIAGGGYGPLSRRDGLTVDYLHAVEVVVVDRAGRARAVVATRDPADPNHDLWWAHTGGGGGNFGVVTRYWMRDPAARGDDPAKLLPRPPATVLSGLAIWSWDGMTRESFGRLLRNHGEWHERHSGPGSPHASLWGSLLIPGRQEGADPGGMILPTQIDASVPGAEKLLTDYFAAVGEGVTPQAIVPPLQRDPWFYAARTLSLGEDAESGRYKGKSAYLRSRFTDEQAGIAFDHLTAGGAAAGGMLWLLSYGGRVNSVAPTATATVERRSILKVIHLATWDETQDGTAHLEWVRGFHSRTFAGTGGVPVPGGNCGGAYINYPDIDHADPAWNTSGVPWSTIYYADNYPRLQRVKARWDPRNVFRHALSIRPPAGGS